MSSEKTVCGLYTRVSSRNQADADYSSLETQRERLEAYCRSQEGYSVHRVYEDGGFSADSLERPALKAMLRDLREGKINCVLTYKIDRLTRSVRDFHQLMDLFDRNGVKFVSVTQSIDTQNPMGRLLRNVLLDFAQFEREMTADRTRDKMRQRAQKGMWNGGCTPYGYAARDKRLVVHPGEAERVRFMFRRFAAAPSLAGLRNELQRLGWYARSGRPWIKTALDQVLRNPIYCGLIRFHSEQFQGEHEALIDADLFQAVQSIRRDRSHPAARMTRVFLLKGLIHCAVCGSWMTPHYTQKKHKDASVYRIPYYRCTKTVHVNNAVCSVKHINADLVERAVIGKLADLAQNEEYVRVSVEGLNSDLQRNTEPLEREAKRVKKRIDEIESEIDPVHQGPRAGETVDQTTGNAHRQFGGRPADAAYPVRRAAAADQRIDRPRL